MTEGVLMWVPAKALGDRKEAMNDGGQEATWTMPVRTTIFRTVLQPVALGEVPMGAAAIPSAAPASLVWNFVEPLALPAA